MAKPTPIENLDSLPIEEQRKGKMTTYSIWNGLEMLGGVVLREIDADHAEGKSLFVAPRCQKSGIGTRLALHLLEQARQRNYREVFLETGATDAFAPARKLFAELGFEECEHFGDYPVEGSVFMKLKL